MMSFWQWWVLAGARVKVVAVEGGDLRVKAD